MQFKKDKLIRFHHCDPAGIVFYPRYFVLFHELYEDWFSEGLGGSYSALVLSRGMAMPMVRLECDFLSSSGVGDTLDLALSVHRVGNASLTFGVSGTNRGKECVRAAMTAVHISLEGHRAVAIPDDLRAAMSRFMTQKPTRG